MLNSFNLLSSHVIYYEVSSIVFVVGIKDYECSLCFKKFARNEHYNRHMNDVHTRKLCITMKTYNVICFIIFLYVYTLTKNMI